MKRWLFAAATALCLLAVPALAADKVKIGLLTTLVGPGGPMGRNIKDGAELALQMLGGKMGGLPVEIIYGEDQGKPDVGRQVAEEMVKKDHVDFIIGEPWSNVLLAIYKPVIDSGTILVGGYGTTKEIAGEMCAPNFFNVGVNSDEPGEAMGKYMLDAKIDDVYIMAPNFTGGKGVLGGFKRYYKGNIVAEVYTSFAQADFQAEITQIRAANPKAVFVFYPAALGVQFVKQYAQSGLNGKIPLYSVSTANETTLPAIGEAADGEYEAGIWSSHLDNPQNQRFVSAFRAKYGYAPSAYSAILFDTVNLIDAAVRAVHGKIEDKNAVIAAMEKADVQSVRGPFKFNSNHFQIQDWYLFRIAKDTDGSYYPRYEKTVFSAKKDSYYENCKMK
jgi:branched-chain amino acid transport system substrate-binding protein